MNTKYFTKVLSHQCDTNNIVFQITPQNVTQLQQYNSKPQILATIDKLQYNIAKSPCSVIQYQCQYPHSVQYQCEGWYWYQNLYCLYYRYQFGHPHWVYPTKTSLDKFFIVLIVYHTYLSKKVWIFRN